MFENDHHRQQVEALRSTWETGAERCAAMGLQSADIAKTMCGVAVARWLVAEGPEAVTAGLVTLLKTLSEPSADLPKSATTH